jgi:hypothetical protein
MEHVYRAHVRNLNNITVPIAGINITVPIAGFLADLA